MKTLGTVPITLFPAFVGAFQRHFHSLINSTGSRPVLYCQKVVTEGTAPAPHPKTTRFDLRAFVSICAIGPSQKSHLLLHKSVSEISDFKMINGFHF